MTSDAADEMPPFSMTPRSVEQLFDAIRGAEAMGMRWRASGIDWKVEPLDPYTGKGLGVQTERLLWFGAWPPGRRE